MVSKVIIEKNAYHDSVTLMSLSGKVLSKEGVNEAVVSMATVMNKELLDNIGLLTEEAKTATENDLIIAVKAENEAALTETMQFIDDALNKKKTSKKTGQEKTAETLPQALDHLPDANLAIISVPGEYAAREARLALNKGLHVMMFSDNVTIEDERALKELGRDKGLLVMGPDCGTAMLNQTGLCFANNVREGGIGLVAASGTGLQEVAVQIDRLGYGVSQAIGTGGRDLHKDIGGIMMLEGLRALNEDDETSVIALISKPPAKEVQDKILAEVKKVNKPVIVGFLDGDKEAVEASDATFASTLIETARQAVLALDPSVTIEREMGEKLTLFAENEQAKLDASQQYIRGLFCGGTLTSEALSILRSEGLTVKSNVAKRPEEKLDDIHVSTGHTLLDMGDDDFTKGKPHPMIEPSLRNERIREELLNKETAVLLLDFELGYGAHEDPVGESIGVLRETLEELNQQGRHVTVISYMCATKNDKQGYDNQVDRLSALGVYVASSNEEMSQLAAMITKKEVK
ncbi:MAG: acyl-CoA synthetase FdrA [Bacillota bacterium]